MQLIIYSVIIEAVYTENATNNIFSFKGIVSWDWGGLWMIPIERYNAPRPAGVPASVRLLGRDARKWYACGAGGGTPRGDNLGNFGHSEREGDTLQASYAISSGLGMSTFHFYVTETFCFSFLFEK
jgi:hypothetical protein